MSLFQRAFEDIVAEPPAANEVPISGLIEGTTDVDTKLATVTLTKNDTAVTSPTSTVL
jgi:hypothetical protein